MENLSVSDLMTLDIPKLFGLFSVKFELHRT